MLEKERIRRIITKHKISSFNEEDYEALTNILYEIFKEFGKNQKIETDYQNRTGDDNPYDNNSI